MKQEVLQSDDPVPVIHHHKPQHIAERIQGYVGIAMVLAVAVLLVIMAVGLIQTGSVQPSWMH